MCDMRTGEHMKTFQRTSFLAAGLLVLGASLMGACADLVEESASAPFPVFQFAGDKTVDPDYDPETVTLKVQREHGLSVVYGEVVKVEPVVDLFSKVPVKDEWVHPTRCASDEVQPALRVHVRVKQASWPTEKDEVVVLGIHLDKMIEPYPTLYHGKDLTWSDGEQYFPKGATFGALGKFNSEEQLVVSPVFFSVDSDGQVVLPEAYKNEPFLAGRTLKELTEGLRASREEVRTNVDDRLGPLYSRCMTHTAEPEPEPDNDNIQPIDCDLPENVDSKPCSLLR